MTFNATDRFPTVAAVQRRVTSPGFSSVLIAARKKTDAVTLGRAPAKLFQMDASH